MKTFDDLTDPFLPTGFCIKDVIDSATKEMITKARIAALLSAYDKALENEDTKIPTVLHAAIEALRRGL